MGYMITLKKKRTTSLVRDKSQDTPVTRAFVKFTKKGVKTSQWSVRTRLVMTHGVS